MGFQDSSIYKFFLVKDFAAIFIAFASMAFHFLILILFLNSADYRSGDTEASFGYTCPRNSLECSTASRVTSVGFALFTMIVIAFLAKDFIDGILMVYECIRKPNKRGIFAGTTVVFITSYSFCVSYIYNGAVGLSNVEVLSDAAILLFLNDIDEQIYSLLETIAPDWINKIDDNIGDMFADNDPIPDTNEEGEKTENMF